MYNRCVPFKKLFKYGFYYKLYRQYGSVLYITGNKGTDMCATVIPQVDMKSFLENFDNIQKNVNIREININLNNLRESCNFYCMINDIKDALEKRKEIIQESIHDIKKNQNFQELEKLQIHSKVIREDLKNLKTALWPIEENVMIQILALPNNLHPETPENCEIELFLFNNNHKEVFENCENHINIGKRLNLLTYNSPYNYYLKNNAAIFELKAKFFFNEQLRNNGFVQFSNPDFARSTIVEGCGLNHLDPNKLFILHEDLKVNENKLHLIGGGSLIAFAAYHTRHIIPRNCLPLKYFTFGRQYKPVSLKAEFGLFEVSQSSVIEIFIATENKENVINQEFDQVVAAITDIYKKIAFPFQVCKIPANKIHSWESMRISFRMYSPFLKKYIEVGNLSISDEFISRRLQFTYKYKNEYCFPKIISGTIMNVPKFLGCLLEQNSQNDFQIPKVFEDIF